jgi:hypothetical protein
LSASYTASCDIPFVGGMSFTASTTVSYDWSEGEEHTVSEEQNIQETKEFPCPPRSCCLFKLITRKLDNVDMPFEATVQRNTEVRVMGNCNSNCSNIEICNNNVNYNGNHPEVYLLQAIHQWGKNLTKVLCRSQISLHKRAFLNLFRKDLGCDKPAIFPP